MLVTAGVLMVVLYPRLWPRKAVEYPRHMGTTSLLLENGIRIMVARLGEFGEVTESDVAMLQQGVCVVDDTGKIQKKVENSTPSPRVCIACRQPVEEVKG